jgi:hypothetical protein
MIAREELHRLVDELPQEELAPAGRLLEFLRDRAKGEPTEISVTLEPGHPYKLLSPRFTNPADADHFRMEVSVEGERPEDKKSA